MQQIPAPTSPDRPRQSSKPFDVAVTAVVEAGPAAAAKPKPKPPRMCGSRSTCVALTETDPKKK